MKNYNSITIHSEDDDAFDHRHHHNLQEDNPHPQDHLVPPFSSSNTAVDNINKRPSNLLVGSFNLIATILGGGVLTLPIAFQKCGILVTTLFMLISAYMTYMSLIMLCYCSRRSGASSYGEICRSAFGTKAEIGVNWVLFVYLLFVIAAFMVLIRDIWVPLVDLFLGGSGGRSSEEDNVNSDVVLMSIIVFLLPFLFQRSLHSLKWNCYIGFVSILILCTALCRGGFQRQYGRSNEQLDDEDDDTYAIEFFKIPSVQECLFSFPIVMLAYLCQFNILSIQNTLHQPTRRRMKQVIGLSVGASMMLLYFFGLGGYMLYGANVQGNVLLNISVAKNTYANEGLYWLFLLGRIGCGVTLVLALPLSFLPCRDALLEVIDVWFHHSHQYSPGRLPSVLIEEETTIGFHESSQKRTILFRHHPIQEDYVFRNSVLHYSSTLLIVTACFFAATRVSGVATIWSLVGSSLAFLIAFIIPFGCFMVIEKSVEGNDRHDRWITLAKAMVFFSVIGAVVCTWNRLSSWGDTM